MIHICYAIYDPHGTYAKFVGVSLRSALVNSRDKITAHILCDETLTDLNRSRLQETAAENGGEILFHRVRLPDDIDRFMKGTQYSPASLYRLMLPDIIDRAVTKIIYLDADTVVNLDLAELADFDTKGHCLAAAPDVSLNGDFAQTVPLLKDGTIERGNYFNSGVLLIDLDKLRCRHDFFAECLARLAENKRRFIYYDQDLLNLLFKDNYSLLPEKFNCISLKPDDSSQGRVIYHYSCDRLDFEPVTTANRLFFEHFVKTPWCDAALIMKLCSYTRFFQDWGAQRATEVRERLSKYRRRIFWCEPRWSSILAENFALSAEDVVITDQQLTTDGLLVVRMNEILKILSENAGQEQQILVVVTQHYPKIRGFLTELGFVANRDFLDGRILIPCRYGQKIWSDYNVVRDL